MGEIVNVQSVVSAIVVAIIFAFVKLFRDVDQIKTSQKYEVDALKTEIKPVITWFEKTSMDAMRIATNPTSERLAGLADRYIADVKGDRSKTPLTARETQELMDGLREVMNDTKEYASKRQSASMSLRFIETREGLAAKAASNSINH